MSRIPLGPTYEEMRDPSLLPQDIKDLLDNPNLDEMDPLNLMHIHWYQGEKMHRVILPKALTGVDANIVVLLGNHFPSGSHKVGPAYATLMEGCVDGTIIPHVHTILGPSTGNFGIGVAYICALMGYEAIVIMPDNMSQERYERIRNYGAKLDLTKGTESDVILTLERTYALKQNANYRALAQFELLPNYRFHRHVTGHACVEAVKDVGNGRIAAFTSAPGSAGTIAAGDHIKQMFPEAKLAALEPYECATLTHGGRGQHRIEGIGDKMCTLIHNVLNTDFVIMIEDEACVQGLKVVQERFETLKDCFGVSGICNILGAIKMAKHLKLGSEDNVVTIATDGFDRYASVLDHLDKRYLEITDTVLDRWHKDVFLEADDKRITDFRSLEKKQQLFDLKEKDWLPFGYTKAYLDRMRHMDFWDEAYQEVFEYNEKIKAMRGKAVPTHEHI